MNQNDPLFEMKFVHRTLYIDFSLFFLFMLDLNNITKGTNNKY